MAELIVPPALRERHRAASPATSRGRAAGAGPAGRDHRRACRRQRVPVRADDHPDRRRATRCSPATCATSPSASAPRRSCAPRARGSSRPPTTRGGGSSATSTTARSSAWSGSRSTCGSRRPRSTRAGARRRAARRGDRDLATGDRRAARARARHPPGGAHEGGLEAALVGARRARAPCRSTSSRARERLPSRRSRSTAYFVVAEALTNVARYAEASRGVVSRAARRRRADRRGPRRRPRRRRPGARQRPARARRPGRGARTAPRASPAHRAGGPSCERRSRARRDRRGLAAAAARAIARCSRTRASRWSARPATPTSCCASCASTARTSRSSTSGCRPTHLDEGLQAARAIRAELPDIGVLMLSQYVEERYARRCSSSGAEGVGYLLKDRVADSDRFTDAMRRVADGGSALDPEVVSHMLGRPRRRRPARRASPRARARCWG